MKSSSKIFSYLILFSFLAFLFLTACDDTITVADVDKRDIPDSNVSFAEHIYPVFQAKCFSCHGDDQDTRVKLTSPAYFVDGVIVVPNFPENSEIMYMVKGTAGYPPMPPNGFSTPLTLDQVQGLETWIKEGAQNN